MYKHASGSFLNIFFLTRFNRVLPCYRIRVKSAGGCRHPTSHITTSPRGKAQPRSGSFHINIFLPARYGWLRGQKETDKIFLLCRLRLRPRWAQQQVQEQVWRQATCKNMTAAQRLILHLIWIVLQTRTKTHFRTHCWDCNRPVTRASFTIASNQKNSDVVTVHGNSSLYEKASGFPQNPSFLCSAKASSKDAKSHQNSSWRTEDNIEGSFTR